MTQSVLGDGPGADVEYNLTHSTKETILNYCTSPSTPLSTRTILALEVFEVATS